MLNRIIYWLSVLIIILFITAKFYDILEFHVIGSGYLAGLWFVLAILVAYIGERAWRSRKKSG